MTYLRLFAELREMMENEKVNQFDEVDFEALRELLENVEKEEN